METLFHQWLAGLPLALPFIILALGAFLVELNYRNSKKDDK